MLADMLWRQVGLLPTDPGYGYFRPHVRLFNAGWRGPLIRGSRHEITADHGNDPVGLISRPYRAAYLNRLSILILQSNRLRPDKCLDHADA
ncbi:TPA: hypothetical protein ACH3X2_012845 [Trebouxia sp. C0005]